MAPATDPATQGLAGGRDPLSGPSGDGGASGGRQGKAVVLSDDDYSTLGKDFYKTMGIATQMAENKFITIFGKVASAVGATTQKDKEKLEVALTYYFAVHGTSPDTQWSTYDKDFAFNGASYKAGSITSLIGTGSLKQFCARFSKHAASLYANSAEFRAALAERVGRLGLDETDGIFVIDFYGKDGTLDSASMHAKALVRNDALKYRASNLYSAAGVKNREEARGRSDTPVVPVSLSRSFKDN